MNTCAAHSPPTLVTWGRSDDIIAPTDLTSWDVPIRVRPVPFSASDCRETQKRVRHEEFCAWCTDRGCGRHSHRRVRRRRRVGTSDRRSGPSGIGPPVVDRKLVPSPSSPPHRPSPPRPQPIRSRAGRPNRTSQVQPVPVGYLSRLFSPEPLLPSRAAVVGLLGPAQRPALPKRQGPVGHHRAAVDSGGSVLTSISYSKE